MGGSIFLGILCILFLLLKAKEDKSLPITAQVNKVQGSSVRSDLPLPQDNVFLRTSKTNCSNRRKIKRTASHPSHCPCRDRRIWQNNPCPSIYANSKFPCLSGKFNAETKGSLIGSFENLAYALSKTEEEEEVLRELQDIKNQEEKRRKNYFIHKVKIKISHELDFNL